MIAFPSMKIVALGVCAALALSSLAGLQGYRVGYSAADADFNAKLMAQMEAGRKLEADRRALSLERDNLARQLEEEGNSMPVLVDRCLAPARVQRLNAIR